MKKLLLMAFAAVFTLGANAQDEHLEWTAASLPQTLEDAYALGYQDYWGMGYCIPGDYVLCESSRFKAYIEKPFICTTGNSGYSGASRYAFKPLMGMNNTTRSGIESLYFYEGLENNDYVRESSYSNEGVEYTYTDAIVTLEVAPTVEGDGIYAQVSLTYNRGGNNSAMYVVDASANDGEGMMVLQSVTRGQDGNPQDHVARFGVEPGHTYYVMASEKASVELYGITYDECASDSYEQLISEDNCTGLWTAASLPQTLEDAYALGYQDYWAMGYCIPGDYQLFEDGDFSAYIEKPFICTTGNGGYSGHLLYDFKPLMGMNNTTRSGIESLYFYEGLENNDYVRESSYSNEGVEYTYTDAIATLKVAAASDENPDGTYGRVTLNYNRGGNNSAMYVVDATANDGEGMMVLQTVTRCPSDAVKTHAPQFNVEPGHTYYVMASEKASVELYGIGFCPVSSEKYSSAGTTGIQNITASSVTVTDNKIYSIDGRYLGTEKGNLGKGLYIMNGKKFVVK